MISCNTDKYFWFKLSKDGERILKEFYSMYDGTKYSKYIIDHKVDEDGFTQFQIWEFFQIYYEYLDGKKGINPLASREYKTITRINDVPVKRLYK